MSVEVRRAEPEEYDEAGRVTALAYREFVRPGEEAWERYLDHIADIAGRADRTTILVAVDGGTILGSATLEIDQRVGDEDESLRPGEAHVRMVGVDPAARGRGAGRALMDACVAVARDAGKSFVTLNTTGRMRTAQRMYRAMGFRPGPDRVFPDGFVLLSYGLALDAEGERALDQAGYSPPAGA